MIELYKIITNKYDNKVTDFIKFNSNNKGTRGHQYKIEKQQHRLNIRGYSFICRSTDLWNNQPEQVVGAPTIKAFESRLDRFWQQVPWRFDWEEPVMSARLQRPDEELTPKAEEGLPSDYIV